MLLKNSEVTPAIEALETLLTAKVPVKTAFAMRGWVRVLSNRATDIEAERRKMLDGHIVRTADGEIEPVLMADGTVDTGQVKVDKGYGPALVELMSIEFDTELKPIHVDELGSVEVDTLTLLKLGNLLIG